MLTCCRTHSENPHNDYCQHFVDTRRRPQNFIRDPPIEERFAEYPKLHELMLLKKQQLALRATPPMYHKCNLEDFDFVSLVSHPPYPLLAPLPSLPLPHTHTHTHLGCTFLLNLVSFTTYADDCNLCEIPEVSVFFLVPLLSFNTVNTSPWYWYDYNHFYYYNVILDRMLSALALPPCQS